MPRNLLKILLCLYCSTTFADSTKLTGTQFGSSELDSTTAKMFNLTVSDWQRYKQIKRGPAGYYNPNMNPVIMLGVYAKDADDLKRLAKIAAKNNYEYTQKTLDFQHAYKDAFNELYPDAQLFDFDAMEAKQDKYTPQNLDNFVLFVKTENCPECIKRYKELLKISGIKLNIHFDTSDEKAIFAWATAQNVPRDMVKNHTITLNKLSGLNAEWGVHDYPTLLKKSYGEAEYQVVK